MYVFEVSFINDHVKDLLCFCCNFITFPSCLASLCSAADKTDYVGKVREMNYVNMSEL